MDERVVFLTGKKVNLRPLNMETDLEKCLRWINDPDVRLFLRSFWPFSAIGQKEWFKRLEGDKNNIILAIEDRATGEFIGNMGLHNIHWVDRVATTGALIGESRYWGQGFGTDAKMVFLNYAFNTLNLRRICSSTFSFNERSIGYNKRCGYKEEGVLKRHVFRDGQYHDEVLLAVFREDWLPLWERYKKTGSLK